MPTLRNGRLRRRGHHRTADLQALDQGLARSFQITSLFLDLTALDNVALAVQAHAGNSFHFWRNARKQDRAARAGARGAGACRSVAPSRYGGVKHEPRRASPARNRHGAGDQPRMLLLDEPMAGMGPEESARMVKTLLRTQEA